MIQETLCFESFDRPGYLCRHMIGKAMLTTRLTCSRVLESVCSSLKSAIEDFLAKGQFCAGKDIFQNFDMSPYIASSASCPTTTIPTGYSLPNEGQSQRLGQKKQNRKGGCKINPGILFRSFCFCLDSSFL